MFGLIAAGGIGLLAIPTFGGGAAAPGEAPQAAADEAPVLAPAAVPGPALRATLAVLPPQALAAVPAMSRPAPRAAIFNSSPLPPLPEEMGMPDRDDTDFAQSFSTAEPVGAIQIPAPIQIAALAPANLGLTAPDLAPAPVAAAAPIPPAAEVLAEAEPAPAPAPLMAAAEPPLAEPLAVVAAVPVSLAPVAIAVADPVPAPVAPPVPAKPLLLAAAQDFSLAPAPVRRAAARPAAARPAAAKAAAPRYQVSPQAIEFSIPVQVNGVALGKLPLRIAENEVISIQLKDLVTLFAPMLGQDQARAFGATTAANEYVSFAAMRRAGIDVRYEPIGNQVLFDVSDAPGNALVTLTARDPVADKRPGG